MPSILKMAAKFTMYKDELLIYQYAMVLQIMIIYIEMPKRYCKINKFRHSIAVRT